MFGLDSGEWRYRIYEIDRGGKVADEDIPKWVIKEGKITNEDILKWLIDRDPSFRVGGDMGWFKKATFMSLVDCVQFRRHGKWRSPMEVPRFRGIIERGPRGENTCWFCNRNPTVPKATASFCLACLPETVFKSGITEVTYYWRFPNSRPHFNWKKAKEVMAKYNLSWERRAGKVVERFEELGNRITCTYQVEWAECIIDVPRCLRCRRVNHWWPSGRRLRAGILSPADAGRSHPRMKDVLREDPVMCLRTEVPDARFFSNMW